MNTLSLKPLVVKFALVLSLVVGMTSVVSAQGPAPARQAPANSPQQKLLAKALTPEVRQTLQDAIDSSDAGRVTTR